MGPKLFIYFIKLGSKNCLYTIENSGPKLFIYFIELGSKIVYILDRNRVQNCLLRFIELGTKIAIRTGSVIFTTRLILIYKIVLTIAHQTVKIHEINIDYYMTFFISYPLSARDHDISPRTDSLG